jgi:hemoglobin
MRDIENKNDIEVLMKAFYAKAIYDKTIGHYFTEVVVLNLEKHLPIICNFWDSVVFNQTGYQGNVMQVHQHLHTLSAFTGEHFKQWILLFKQTVDEYFEGDNSEKIKQRAESIATVMNIKLVHGGIGMK